MKLVQDRIYSRTVVNIVISLPVLKRLGISLPGSATVIFFPKQRVRHDGIHIIATRTEQAADVAKTARTVAELNAG
jgi:hypothetical protein